MSYNPVTGASFSGAPYSSKAINANPVKNNGATIMYGGHVRSNYGASEQVPCSQALGNTYFGYNSGTYGSKVPLAPQGMGVGKAISGGNFASMTAGSYIGMVYNNGKIAGVSSSLLRSGAGYSGGKSENSFTGIVRTHSYIKTGGWNYVTGQPINRTDVTDVIPTETLPTRAIPGRLTYMITGKRATTASYVAKTE